MNEVRRSRIFEPFFISKPVDEGTGQGLSVVHGIVKAHEANIEVQSPPGEGSEFSTQFPAIDAPVSEVMAHVRDAAPVHGKGRRVLCVDDEKAIVV